MRFMTCEYVFLIDIQKMFLSIELEQKSDCDMLRLLWGLPRQEIKHYSMKVVTFGLISSPYQACTCLKVTAKVHALMYLLAAAIIIADSYMDDITSGTISVAEGRKLIMQILDVMDAGGFRGHKISTSNPAMVEGIPPDQVDPSRMVSVLGLKLNHDRNEFLFNLEEKFQNYDANKGANHASRCHFASQPNLRYSGFRQSLCNAIQKTCASSVMSQDILSASRSLEMLCKPVLVW